MTAGSAAPSPMVPAKLDVREATDFRFSIPKMLDSDWYHSCSKEEALAGINLHARSLHQLPGGSLPSSEALLARLADYARDVEGFLAVKSMAMQGWTLCADGRWYHPDTARNALHIWIARLERRRYSACGNQVRAPDRDFGLQEILADIEAAAHALRAIDPQDKMLRDITAKMAKWAAKASSPEGASDADQGEAST